MTPKSIPKNAPRDRTDWGRASVAPLTGFGRSIDKLAETAAVVTAAGAATIGVTNTQEAHATNDLEQAIGRKMPATEDHPGTLPPETSTPSSKSADGGSTWHEGTSHQGASHVSAGASDQVQINAAHAPPSPHASASNSLESEGARHAADAVSVTQTGEPAIHASSETLSPAHDDVVSRLAEQITSSVGHVLTAVQQGGLDGTGSTLAETIFQTANSIVEDIRAQIPNVKTIIDNSTAPIPTIVHAAVGDLPDIGHQVQEAVSDINIVDALNGKADFDAPTAQPIDGLVGELTGLATDTLPNVLDDVAATAANIPASMLGGAEPTHGILTGIFYDDGGSEGLSGSASQTASVPEPADLGFLGQPLANSDELTGIFHGSSSMHLV